ncbi:MAG: AAA family ATPase, partial [Spirochaetota bacterium]
MDEIRMWGESVIAAVEKAFVGKRAVIEKLLVAVLARGHVLLEDVPGVGKTVLAHALARALGVSFKRIQCTPDLLPADIIGVSIFDQKRGRFRFRKGPLHASFVLVDEVNRATPRSQSALLEAMAEGQVSVEGRRIELPKPFFLIATENPIEFEGTFPLPEAQKDRFLLSLNIGYPVRAAEEGILEMQRRTTHPVFDVTAVSDVPTILRHQEQTVSIN